MTLPRPRHALTALTLTLTLTGCVSPSFMTSKEGTMDDPRYAQLLDLIGEALKDTWPWCWWPTSCRTRR